MFDTDQGQGRRPGSDLLACLARTTTLRTQLERSVVELRAMEESLRAQAIAAAAAVTMAAPQSDAAGSEH